MKFFLVLAILLLNVFNVKSQAIGYLDMPVVGEFWIEFKDTIGANVSISAAGPGQNYNYLNSFAVHDTIQYLHQNISSIPTSVASLYPLSTLVIPGEVAGDYTFVRINFTGMYIDGVHSDNGIDLDGYLQNDILYSPDLLYLPIPFQYGDVVQNTSSYSHVFPDSSLFPGAMVRATYTTFQDMETDGQGAITTPLGTYNSVIRIKEMITKSVLYEIDSFSIGNYTYITDFTEPTSYAYKWLKSGPNCLIMTAEADNNNIVTSASYFTSSGLVNSKSINNEEDFYLYPNPVNEGNEIMLFLNNNNSKIVKIFDSSGRELFHNKISEGITKVDLSTQSYEAGLYYLTVYNDNHTQAVLKFSVVK